MSINIEWDEMIIPLRKGYIKYVREFVRDSEYKDENIKDYE
ncbi:MAG: hypothetical protein PWP03_506 [Candidatus Woesearchaeota archaeon]|nr:hypothetical protein [Candidatus Woesearchaeota archaeon]